MEFRGGGKTLLVVKHGWTYNVACEFTRMFSLGNMVEKARMSVETLDAKWGRLASLALRGLVAKKGRSYPQLATAIANTGAKESWRSVEGKIQRGGYSFAFFLQCVMAMKADCPDSWDAILRSTRSPTEAAATILTQEMSKVAGMSLSVLRERLAWIGIQVPEAALETDIATGALTFKLFLQCAAVLPVSNVTRFVDASDLRALATEGISEAAATATQPTQ